MAGARGIEAGRAYVRIFSEDSDLVKGLRGIESRMGKLGANVGQVGAKVATLGAGITGLAGVGAAAIAWPLQLAANMEATEASFTTLLKDTNAAKMLLGDIQKFAASTPFQFEELADASKKLLAFGSNAKDVESELRRIGDIASAIGAPIGEIAEIYGKARVQGRLFAEDINQLTGRGIPIIQELAKQFGVADTEIKEMVKDGKVNFGNLERAFIALTSGAGQFAGGMERQSKTLNGAFSTLKDNITAAFRPFGEALLPAAKAALTVGTKLVQTFGQWAQRNKEMVLPIAAAVAAVGALGVAATTAGVAIIGVGAAISAVGSIAGTIATVVSAIGAPAIAITAGITAGVLALGAGFAYVANQAGLMAPAFEFLKQSFGRVYVVFQAAFGGIIKALQGGQFQLAAEIAWAGVKVATLKGAQQVLKGVDYLWNNAGQLSARFFSKLIESTYNVFKELPRIAFQALQGGAALRDAIQRALAGAFTADLDLAARLDPAIGQAQQQFRQRLGQANRIGQGGPPPREIQNQALRPQGARANFAVPAPASVAPVVNAAVARPVAAAGGGGAAIPGMSELVGLSRQQVIVLRQILGEGLG